MLKYLYIIQILSFWTISLFSDDSLKLGELHIDPPTLICLGFTWEIEGDQNRNASAHVKYRKKGDLPWKEALPLLRTGDYVVGRSSDWLDVTPPPRLSGSIVDLNPDTLYEVMIEAKDPDGFTGESKHQVEIRTRAEPTSSSEGQIYHVFPPSARPKWPQNEFSNLYKAYYGGLGNIGDFNMVWEKSVKPGDTILIHAGLYKANLNHYTDKMGVVPDGTYWLTNKGTPDKPITIKAAGDGEVIFDGSGCEVLFNMMAADYHIIEGLTFRNCGYAIFAGQQRVMGCKGLTVKGCRFENVRDGIFSLYNGSENFYIADCIFLGRNERERFTAWGNAEDAYLKSNTAITLQGSGHVVTRNAMAYFWQGYHMGTAFQGFEKGGVACDIYENDFFMMIDDGAEIDGCVRNVRVMRNRFINVGSPMSTQPVYGGPAYFIRNVCYNTRTCCKFHEAHPSGLVSYHNTLIGRNYIGRGLYTNAHFRNNLFLGGIEKPGKIAFPSPLNGVSADYNGYHIKTKFMTTELDGFKPIMDKSRNPWWPKKPYPPRGSEDVLASFQDLQQRTGLEAHGILIDYDVFSHLSAQLNIKDGPPVSPKDIDFSLNPKGAAIDAGIPLPNINEGFSNQGPDLGAYELGKKPPQYGPSGNLAGTFDITLFPTQSSTLIDDEDTELE